MTAVMLADPMATGVDLTTRGSLLRYSRLRDAGLSIDLATLLADAGWDAAGVIDLPTGELS